MFSFVTLRRNARLRILLLYVFIIIKKRFFLFIYVFKTCHYVKSYEPCKSKKNTPWELAHEDVLFFLIYTATAVHEAGTSVSANGYGLILISHLYFQTASLLLRPRP